MQISRTSILAAFLAAFLAAGAAAAQAPGAGALGPEYGNFVIRNATVVPVTGPRVPNASVVIVNGKIAAVGTNVTAPAGAKVIDGDGLFVYPGLIDSGTQLGLTEMGGVPGPVDTRELGEFNPQDVVMTAVNASSEHIAITRANGTTTALTAAGGSVLSGIAAIINLAGYTREEMEAKAKAALLVSWPGGGGGGRGGGGGGRGGRGGAPGGGESYQSQVHTIYTWFDDARAYADVKQRLSANGAQLPVSFHINQKYEAMTPAIRGDMPVLIDANTTEQMRDAIKFADSMKVKIVIRGALQGWKIADTLAAHHVPVVVAPVTSPPPGEDPYDEVYANPGVLSKAGVLVSFQSGSASSARDLPYEAGLAESFGMDPEEVLKAVTINPAKTWGIDKEYGSIEVGKWANLIVTTGDPIDIRSHIKEVFIKGVREPFNDRHTRFYEEYRAKPKPGAKPPT
jgi:imidazolonepropionase-like amidohydrolase